MGKRMKIGYHLGLDKALRRAFTMPSAKKQIAAQQAAMERQFEMQRQLQDEAERRAEERVQREEAERTAKAAAELRSRLSSMQGRRGLRAASDTRAILNQMGVLG
jgi:beta-phosphoglucomutase-like phosphatase (HAD superfamily)